MMLIKGIQEKITLCKDHMESSKTEIMQAYWEGQLTAFKEVLKMLQ